MQAAEQNAVRRAHASELMTQRSREHAQEQERQAARSRQALQAAQAERAAAEV